MSTRRRKIGLIVLVLCCLGVVARQAPRQSMPSLIRDGSYGHSHRAGWVNWGHARPEGPAAFQRSIRAAWQAASDPPRPFRVSYGQTMQGRLTGDWWLSSGYSATYEVAAGLTEEELDLAAWHIFREVSSAFETVQGSLPSALDIRSSDSAFRAGDLMGDRLAFYAALRGLSVDELRRLVEAESVAESLAIFDRLPPAPIREWSTPETLPESLRDLDAALPEITQKMVRIDEHESYYDLVSKGPS